MTGMIPEKTKALIFSDVAVALLFGFAFVAALFFNGVRIEYFSLSLFILMLLLLSFSGAVMPAACTSPKPRCPLP